MIMSGIIKMHTQTPNLYQLNMCDEFIMKLYVASTFRPITLSRSLQMASKQTDLIAICSQLT